MRLFDLHCDTAFEMYRRGSGLDDLSLHVNFDGIMKYEKYSGIFAIWSDRRLSDKKAYEAYRNIITYLKSKISPLPCGASVLFSVEDARMLEGKMSRIDELISDGISLVTPMWRGENILGGAYDTNMPLTKFGKAAIEKLLSAGVLADISHASVAAAEQIAYLAISSGKPVIASHSDSFAVNPHPRNLRDRQFQYIRDSGGVVGICLEPTHLSPSGEAGIEDVVRHIEHFLSLGGENTVAIGTDFDGIETTPRSLGSLSELTALPRRLAALNYSEELISKIMYKNAARLFPAALAQGGNIPAREDAAYKNDQNNNLKPPKQERDT